MSTGTPSLDALLKIAFLCVCAKVLAAPRDWLEASEAVVLGSFMFIILFDGLRLASVGRNAERQDPQGLGPKDEHAVTPKAADAQTPGDTPHDHR